MYDDIEEFKRRLEDDLEFKELFINVDNLDEAVAIARENGYNLDMDSVINDRRLTDDMLEAVAGGSNKDSNEEGFTDYLDI